MPKFATIRSWLRRICVVLICAVLLFTNVRLYTPASTAARHSQIEPHLKFLGSEIDRGLAEQMQTQFPEGYFFTHALYGLTWVELGLQPAASDNVRNEALSKARLALVALDSPAGRAPFSERLDPAFGGFYVGWTNYLRAGVVALQIQGLGIAADDAELRQLKSTCDTIVDAADRVGPYLASYPGQVWPVDTYPAMVSVKACAEFVDRRYGDDIEAWLRATESQLDESLGLQAHRLEPFREHPRATSQTMILRFLAELDPERSADAYERFRSEFVVSRFGIPGVREHPQNVNAGGDVDSGPLITGVSASATVVAIGAAQVNGDYELAQAIRQEAEGFGFPVTLPGGRRYAAGALPIGDLFMVWASSARPWFQPEPARLELGPGWHWRLPTHLLSLVVGATLWFVVWPGTRERTHSVRRRLSRNT